MNIQIQGIEELLKAMHPERITSATISALNRAARSGQAAGVREITQDYDIKRTEANKTFTIYNAGRGNYRAIIKSRGFRIKLSKFKYSVNRANIGRIAKGLSSIRSTVRRGQSRYIPHAFQARMASGHVGIYMRQGEKRLPIKELSGPSVPQLLKGENVQAKISEAVTKTFKDYFVRSMQFGRYKR